MMIAMIAMTGKVEMTMTMTITITTMMIANLEAVTLILQASSHVKFVLNQLRPIQKRANQPH
jgi:hypothetical protein